MTGVLERRRVYIPAGRTLSAFHDDSVSQVRMLLGPIGSGKTSACVAEVLRRMREQAPNGQGVRRTRWAFIRKTMPRLKTTTIDVWREWCSAPVVMSSPIVSRVRTKPAGDGTRVQGDVYFVSLDRPGDVGRVLSMALTGAFVNEAQETPQRLFSDILGRCGRFPAEDDGGPTWSGVIADTNLPDTEHWIYKVNQLLPENWAFYRQPGGLIKRTDASGTVRYVENPKAENISHLSEGYDYYRKLIPSADPEWVKVFVLGEWGTVFEGKAVYAPWWNETLHLAPEPLPTYKGLPLCLGFDFGLQPACVFFQISPRGQLRILRELWCPNGGLEQFCAREVRPLVNTEFGGMPLVVRGEPSGQKRAETDERTCEDVLRKHFGPSASCDVTNDFRTRRDAVISRLQCLVDGQPGFVIDARCKMLVDGFRGGYQFRRVLSRDVEERYTDEVADNDYTHLHDALQAGVLGTFSASGAPSVRMREPELRAPRKTWRGAT